MQFELAALREARSKTGLSRISHGYNRLTPAARKSSSDLDEDTMREVRANNAAVKAMFESAGPKYKFGGGGGASPSKSEADLRPAAVRRRRPSLRPREERRWVLDSINKYFDVIAEEENDDEDEDDDANEGVFYPDSGEDEESDVDSPIEIPGRTGTGPLQRGAGSKRDLRSMFEDAMTRVSGRVGGSREVLVGRFKQNLGSQLSIDEGGIE